MEGKVVKIEMPLDTETDVYIIFNGPIHKREHFVRLHEIVTLLETSLVGPREEVVEPVIIKKKRKFKYKKNLPPCVKHPESPRDHLNICIKCREERDEVSRTRMLKKWEDAKAKGHHGLRKIK